MDRNYDIIAFASSPEYPILLTSSIVFIKVTFKDSNKVKRIRNHV